MSNWYTCLHCGEKNNGEYKRDNHEAVNHPEQHRQRKIRQLTQAVKETEETLSLLQESLAFLEAGHTIQENNERREKVLHDKVVEDFRRETQARQLA